MLVPRKEWPVTQLTGVYGMLRVPRKLDCILVHLRSLLPRWTEVSRQPKFPSRWKGKRSEIRVKHELETQEIWSLWAKGFGANSPTTREIKISRNRRRRQGSCRTGIKISWHPHHAIYPCELEDWSLLLWHPHPTIYLSEVVSVSGREHPHEERMSSGYWVWDRTERDTAGINRRSDRMKKISTEAEGQPKGSVEPRKRGTDNVSKSDTK